MSKKLNIFKKAVKGWKASTHNIPFDPIEVARESANPIVYDPDTFAPMQRGADGVIRQIVYNRDFAMTGSTMIIGINGSYSVPDIYHNTYDVKQYTRDDLNNLISLLTLWVDNENVKLQIKETAAQFDNHEVTNDEFNSDDDIFSEEDIDKFIQAITLTIDDSSVRDKIDGTLTYWKNIKR